MSNEETQQVLWRTWMEVCKFTCQTFSSSCVSSSLSSSHWSGDVMIQQYSLGSHQLCASDGGHWSESLPEMPSHPVVTCWVDACACACCPHLWIWNLSSHVLISLANSHHGHYPTMISWEEWAVLGSLKYASSSAALKSSQHSDICHRQSLPGNGHWCHG